MTVKIVEVGPRDGLQNEKQILSTEEKIHFIQQLANAALTNIEITSFVSPKWVPQMADHQQLISQLDLAKHIHQIVLVPNEKGLDNALRCQVKSIAVFTAASETFSQKNTNCSIKDSLARCKEIIRTAKQQQCWVRGYISCVMGCPYEGSIEAQKVIQLATQLYECGCDEISLGDTIGVGTPKQLRPLLQEIRSIIPVEKLAVHLHDTYGQALANIYAALEEGISIIDSSVAGLGGCPYAKGATGNVATEEVVYLCQGLGIETGIDLNKLILSGQAICDLLNIPNRSKVATALYAKLKGELA